MNAPPAIASLLQAFQFGPARRGEPAGVADRRAASLRRFAQLGLPTRGDEAWRFTDLRPLLGAIAFPVPELPPVGPLDDAVLAPHRLAGAAHRLVLIDGRVDRDRSEIGTLPDGAWLGSVADAMMHRQELAQALFDVSDTDGNQPLASANGGLFQDGFILSLPPGVTLEGTVEILHYRRRPAIHTRNGIFAGARSHATLVETFVGTSPGWTNAVTQVGVDDGARLAHVKAQVEADETVHTALTRARIAGAARYESMSFVAGARLSRDDIQAALTGEGASLALNALCLLRDDQEATIAPFVDHRVPNGQTSEMLKYVIGGHAHGVFLGSILVRPGADQTDARQLTRTLLTSPAARIDAKPELTIHADEVKCGHGATVGDLDEAALFYLLARGIAEATARAMLMEAFAAEVLETAALDAATDSHLRRYLDAWLDRNGGRS